MQWEALGEAAAVEEPGRAVTYKSLAHCVREAGIRLLEDSSDRQRPIGLAFPNSIEFIVLLLACGLAGIPAVLLGKGLKERELEYHIRHSGIRTVLAAPKLDGVLSKLSPHPLHESMPGVHAWSFDTAEAFSFAEDDFICQLTSGTNGLPKAAVRTISAVRHEIEATIACLNMTGQDRVLTVPPIHHSYGLIAGVLAPLLCGASVMLRDTFMAPDILKDLTEGSATILFAVPFMYHLLNERMKGLDSSHAPFTNGTGLETLRLCMSAGAPLARETAEQFHANFGKRISMDYGSTETGVICLNLDWEQDVTSAGKPVGHTLLQLVSEDGQVLPPGQTGLLRIQSPSTARCYAYPLDLNEQSFREGWYYTGDLGWLDEGGNLHLTGRLANTINVAGLKVDPHEVEEIIGRMMGVKESVVVGLPSESTGQLVKAFIVAAEGIDKMMVIQHCRKHLADFKVPKAVELLNELPRSPTGKVLRKYLIEEVPQ
jgi:long-chain acyl-CoA synthetase